MECEHSLLFVLTVAHNEYVLHVTRRLPLEIDDQTYYLFRMLSAKLTLRFKRGVTDFPFTCVPIGAFCI